MLGLALFFGLPELGYTGTEAVTAVFLYERSPSFAFVYPARRITAKPVTNRILDWIMVVAIILQLATISIPVLRTMLGLSPLDPRAFGLIAAALALSVLGPTSPHATTSRSTRSTRAARGSNTLQR